MSIRQAAAEAALKQRQDDEAELARRDEAELSEFEAAARATFYERLKLTPGGESAWITRETRTERTRGRGPFRGDPYEVTELVAYIDLGDLSFRITRRDDRYSSYHSHYGSKPVYEYILAVQRDGEWFRFHDLADLNRALTA